MKSEKTTNQLVIQGVLKEAFFNDSVFVLESKNQVEKYRIVDISESKIRDKSENKRIHFKKIEGNSKFNESDEYEFSSKFHRYTINLKLKFDHINHDEIVFHFPVEIILENLRKADRSKVQIEVQKPSPVVIRSGNLHSEGAFILEDTSQDGYGGTLTVFEGFPIQSKMNIFGKIGMGEELSEMRGTVVTAAMIQSLKPGFDTYRIGIKQLGSQNSEAAYTGVDRRKQQRYQCNLQIELESKLHPGQYLVLDVSNISINGFSGKISSGSVISSVPIGSVFEFKDQKTKVRLIQFNQDHFQFHIYQRSVEDGIAWLKKMTPLIQPGAKTTTKDSRDLYRIFLQAGAVSTQYLKRHQLFDELLVKNGQSESDDSHIHRWYVSGDSNSTEAYSAAIRVGNSCWYMADIAKESDSKVDGRQLTNNFFKSFSEFSIYSKEIGTLLGIWLKDHAYWLKWYRRLKSQHSDLICADITISYLRLPDQFKSEENITVTKIDKESYSLRIEIIKSIPLQVNEFLKYAFDFESSGVGSYAFSNEAESFNREYYLIETKIGNFLSVVNNGISGVSINRFMDSLFLFPITLVGVPTKENFYEIASAFSNKIPNSFSAIRIVSDKYIGAGTEMTCILLYPRAFMTFGK